MNLMGYCPVRRGFIVLPFLLAGQVSGICFLLRHVEVISLCSPRLWNCLPTFFTWHFWKTVCLQMSTSGQVLVHLLMFLSSPVLRPLGPLVGYAGCASLFVRLFVCFIGPSMSFMAAFRAASLAAFCCLFWHAKSNVGV